jgi:hypothetical protein
MNSKLVESVSSSILSPLSLYSTLAKINLCGSDYMSQLLKEIDYEYIPAAVGGGLQLYNEPYTFDLSESGPLYYPGCEQDAVQYIEKRKHFERYDNEEYCYYFSGITPPDSVYSNTNQFDSTRTNFSPADSENSPVDEPTIRLVESTTSTETSAKDSSGSAKDFSGSEDISLSHRRFTALSRTSSLSLQATSGIAEEKEATDLVPCPANSFIPQGNFLSYSVKCHPLLFIFAIVLAFFVAAFHPLIVKSSLPSIIISLVFLYFQES